MSLVKVHNGLDINITNHEELQEAKAMLVASIASTSQTNNPFVEREKKIFLLMDIRALYEAEYTKRGVRII